MRGFSNKTIGLFFLCFMLFVGVQAQKNKVKKVRIVSKDDRLKAEMFVTEGMKFYILENYASALINFKKALNINPNSDGACFKIAETYAQLQDYSQATEYAQQAIELDDKNKYYYVLLARLHEKQRNYSKATQTYEDLLSKNLKGTEQYYFDLALIYQYQLKDYKQAINTFDKIEELFGLSEEVTQQKQQIFIQQGKLDLAIQEAERLLASAPDNSQYSLSLAELLIATKQLDKATSILEKITQNTPKEDIAHAQASLLLADIYKANGQEQKADTQIEQMLNNPNVDAEAKVKLLLSLIADTPQGADTAPLLAYAKKVTEQHPTNAQALTILADIYLAQGQLSEARLYYENALKVDNSQFDLWYQVLKIDTELNQPDLVIKHAEQALELFPNQAVFWLYSGSGYFQKRDYEAALEAFEVGQSYAVSNPSLYNEFTIRLADTYNGLRKFDKADALYEDVLKKDPNNVQALNNYTYYLALREEKLNIAKKNGQKLVSLFPDNPSFVDTYAWVLYKMGDWKEAKKLLEKVVDKTESGTIVEHYGDVLFKLGEKDKAVEQWQKASKMRGASNLIDKKIQERKLYEQ